MTEGILAGRAGRADSTVLAVSREAASRFLLQAQGLDGRFPEPSAAPAAVLRQIRRLECVQIDPVAAVERNQHLVLAARMPGYRPADLEALLGQGLVFEYMANAACVIPLDDYPIFEGTRRRYRTRFASDLTHGRSRGAEPEDGAMIRFLPPLDNLLWRRERVADLFGFQYRWEVYLPEAKRRYGYYTMPILSGSRLIGRLLRSAGAVAGVRSTKGTHPSEDEVSADRPEAREEDAPARRAARRDPEGDRGGVTMETARTAGTAAVQGELWGVRARDWAEAQEGLARPLYVAVLRATGIGKGARLLDVGCGAGLFCALAAERGAQVAGIDATPAFIAIARERVPDGDFRLGEMEQLPYEDKTFDAVTGFNSFQFAANPANALKEARRVAKPGAAVVTATWGKPESCEAAAVLEALRPLLPPPPPGAPGPFALSADGALEALAEQAGLTPKTAANVDCPFEYPNLETLLRGFLSAGPLIKAIQVSGEGRIRDAVTAAIAPFKLSSGGYRLENVFRFLVATA